MQEGVLRHSVAIASKGTHLAFSKLHCGVQNMINAGQQRCSSLPQAFRINRLVQRDGKIIAAEQGWSTTG